jgi:Fic family protein
LYEYLHELPEWPAFYWNYDAFADALAQVRHQQGRLLGRMEGYGFGFRQESLLKTLTQDVVKTSEIEGERLDLDQVRSSLAKRLGIEVAGLKPADRHVDGVVEMMLDATTRYQEPLTAQRLFGWHAALFPTGMSNMQRIHVGVWRKDETGPMQVVSGAIGHEKVHYQAPPAAALETEMARFLDWFNRPNDTDWVLKAALAHLWFLTLHPFDDGNGRMARAIADLALARSEQSSQRFYSMSAQIRVERSAYYETLERTQKGSMDVTGWMRWFLGCMGRAVDGAQAGLSGVLQRGEFWESLKDFALNERQRKVLNRLLDGFEGKLTTSKWGLLAKCSQDTALRDVLPLVELGVLVKGAAGGRSTGYELNAEWLTGSKAGQMAGVRNSMVAVVGHTVS